MLRGSAIIFVSILSFIFLKQRASRTQILGIFLIIIGLTLVGLADLLQTGEKIDTHKIVIGDILIILAQVITASQLVFEQKILADKQLPPLQVVGWEGLFGFVVLSILLIPMYFIHLPEKVSLPPRHVIEDSYDAFIQISHNVILAIASVGGIISIAVFNFAGVSVTKEISATTRMVLDSVRTMVIWIVALMLKWQKFHYLQLIGFTFLVLGMTFYNGLIKTPKFIVKCWQKTVKKKSSDAPKDKIKK
jgi:drug/metabolite transporter (DMT)-like permease